LIKSASHRLLPRSILPFVPPKPLTVPASWAPSILPNIPRSSHDINSQSHTQLNSNPTTAATSTCAQTVHLNSRVHVAPANFASATFPCSGVRLESQT
jgi:hypothetical protein